MATLSLPVANRLKDIPALRQLAVFAGIALAVAAGFGIWSWSQKPGYVPVFSGLSDRDASELADALRTSAIPFEIDANSGAVKVPQDQLYDARLKLAAQGLPHGGSQGFELIQQEQGFGTSQFIENARYQHALETELARTIGSLQPVRGARVHLAIPKASAFARKADAPSASVFIELHNGRQLENDQVASIVHMVASSVSGLQPAAVTVIDQFGHLLSNADPDSAMARTAEQFDYTRRVESDYQRRIEQLLRPLVGSGRLSAQVTADIDYAETEEAREQYGSDPAKVRSEQTSEDVTRNRANKAAGVPGATSNQPAPKTANPPLNSVTAAGAADDDVQTQTKNATRTFELDRTISHTRQSVGKLKRLSVAVLVDHVPKVKTEGKKSSTVMEPLNADELKRVEALVKEAVGFSAERGDSVVVQNSAFVQTEIEAPEDLPMWKQPMLLSIARQVGGVFVVLGLIFFVLRPALKQVLSAPISAPAPTAALEAVITGEAIADDRLSISTRNNNGYEQKLQLAKTAVTQDPKRVAQVVKTWIGQENS